TGGSNGLQCPGDEIRSRLEKTYAHDEVVECRRRLEARADLTQYTTDAAADDLDDVRAALGHQRVDLFGLSYGTRLALVYMRRHPDRVRSAVLMGPAPTDLAMPLHHAPDGQRALDLLLSDCAADPGCHRAFPRLREDLQAVLERLDQAPVAVSLPRAPGAPPSTYHLTRGAFAEKVRTRLYAPSSRRSLPLAIHAASQGDFEPFLDPLRGGKAARRSRGASTFPSPVRKTSLSSIPGKRSAWRRAPLLACTACESNEPHARSGRAAPSTRGSGGRSTRGRPP
ncbi:MAG: hypothetical protein DMF79_05995, partial [Acidobacteria bacterium]